MSKKAYIVNFEHTEIPDLESFHTVVTQIPHLSSWWHYLKGSYILIREEYQITENASTIVNHIRGYYPKASLFVAEIQLRNTGGFLPPDAWNWINGQLRLGGVGLLSGLSSGLSGSSGIIG